MKMKIKNCTDEKSEQQKAELKLEPKTEPNEVTQNKPEKKVQQPHEVSIRVIRPNDIKIEEIPQLNKRLASPKDAFKHLVNKKVVDVEYLKTDIESNLMKCYMHPFAEAVHMAYSHHVPLIITPDVIWHLISGAIAIHINDNAEKLRKVFVDHEGKKELIVRNDKLMPNCANSPWDEVVQDFVVEISANTNNNVGDLLVPTFTTTTACARVVSQMVLLDAMHAYFDYKCFTECGVPEIRLTGTRQDWELIKSRAKEILKLLPDLKVWIKGRLIEILDKFIDVYDGKVDKKFWNEIYKGN